MSVSFADEETEAQGVKSLFQGSRVGFNEDQGVLVLALNFPSSFASFFFLVSFFFSFFFFFFFLASPATCGSSQARDQTCAIAVT